MSNIHDFKIGERVIIHQPTYSNGEFVKYEKHTGAIILMTNSGFCAVDLGFGVIAFRRPDRIFKCEE